MYMIVLQILQAVLTVPEMDQGGINAGSKEAA